MHFTLKSISMRNAAFKVAAIYALFSALWVIFSDQILLLFIEEAATLTRLQTLKGWVFISITSLIIYFLLHAEIARFRRAEGAARESERKLSILMGNLPGMAYRGRDDENRTMEFVSSGCFPLTGYQPADLLDNRTIAYSRLIHPDDRQMVMDQVMLSLAARQPYRLIYRILTAAGEEKWVWEQGVGILSEAGEKGISLEGFITDITEHKRAEESLRLYRDHLEDMVMERTRTLKQEITEKIRLQKQLMQTEKLSAMGRMMENVAHEIRNPLTALGGLTRRLERRIPEGTREKEYAGVIVSEAARLERVLKSVLTLTKGPGPLREKNDLNRLIDETLQPFAGSFQRKSIEIRKHFADIPLVLLNREEVMEAIGNILGNALYATPAGGRISIATAGEHLDGKPWVTVKIADTGKGIAEEQLGMIFEPFFTTRPVSGPDHGIGLGLSIARRIMEEHGGQILVESRPGQGTTFSLYFPSPGSPGRPV